MSYWVYDGPLLHNEDLGESEKSFIDDSTDQYIEDYSRSGDECKQYEDFEGEEYEVQTVVNKRILKGKVQYLLKWVGYDSRHDSWEPIELMNCEEMVAKYERNVYSVYKDVSTADLFGFDCKDLFGGTRPKADDSGIAMISDDDSITDFAKSEDSDDETDEDDNNADIEDNTEDLGEESFEDIIDNSEKEIEDEVEEDDEEEEEEDEENKNTNDDNIENFEESDDSIKDFEESDDTNEEDVQDIEEYTIEDSDNDSVKNIEEITISDSEVDNTEDIEDVTENIMEKSIEMIDKDIKPLIEQKIDEKVENEDMVRSEESDYSENELVIDMNRIEEILERGLIIEEEDYEGVADTELES